MELDDILEQLGGFGAFQKRNYFLISLIMIFSVFPMSYIFTARNINYRCFVDGCDRNVGDNNYTTDWISHAVPMKNNLPSKCLRYERNVTELLANNDTCEAERFNTNVTVKCDRFVYESDKMTIAQDFNVMCEENLWKLTLIGTINCIGELVCLPFSGYISDKYGRKATMIVSVLLSALAGIIKSLTPNYISYVTMEFLDTAIGSGMYGAAYVLAIELVSPEKRVLGNTIMAVAFAIGEALLGFAAWYTPSWRIMLRVLYAPGFLVVSYIWLTQESVRWLLSKRKYGRARKILTMVAKCNGKRSTTDSDTLRRLNVIESDDGDGNVRKESVRDAFRCVPLFLRLINCSYSWICCTFVFYGLTMHSVSITGDPYMNYVAVAFVEIPAYLATYFVLDNLGRRTTLSSSLLVSGAACVSFIFVDEGAYVGRLVLFLLGKFAVTISYTVLYMYTTEMFPTSLRHSLLAVCSMFGRFGSMVAPQVPLLATISSSLPLIMFGAMASSSGLLALAFPETHNTKLPDTIKDALHIGTN